MRLLFAGTFDPPSWGHYEIIRRILPLCTELIVALAVNPNKKPMFSSEIREKMVRGMIQDLPPKITIHRFEGLLADFAKKENVSFFVRGLRTSSDFEKENQMAAINRRLSGIETIFLTAEEKHTSISSSMIREIIHFKGPLKEFVPPSVALEIQNLLEDR